MFLKDIHGMPAKYKVSPTGPECTLSSEKRLAIIF
jgi:hypothetical protein